MCCRKRKFEQKYLKFYTLFPEILCILTKKDFHSNLQSLWDILYQISCDNFPHLTATSLKVHSDIFESLKTHAIEDICMYCTHVQLPSTKISPLDWTAFRYQDMHTFEGGNYFFRQVHECNNTRMKHKKLNAMLLWCIYYATAVSSSKYTMKY